MKEEVLFRKKLGKFCQNKFEFANVNIVIDKLRMNFIFFYTIMYPKTPKNI